MEGWHKLCSLSTPINLPAMLSGGQSFRWKFNKECDEWIGIFKGVVCKLKTQDDFLFYKVIGSLKDQDKKKANCDDEAIKSMLNKYFRIDEDVNLLYDTWAKRDKLFASVANKFCGIRILDQEPVENLFSFICSSNNHISRISSMIEKLCQTYGEKICTDNSTDYYSFPDVENLCNDQVENKLRELGFGYRAKFIQKSAKKISDNGGKQWFEILTKMEYKEAKEKLMELPGVGPKVADCICLMSLNHLGAVPVDTHVYQIASEHYLTHLKGIKNMSDKVYNEIGDHFRKLYGDRAGWAHTVLFCADLKQFKELNGKRLSENKCKKPKRKAS